MLVGAPCLKFLEGADNRCAGCASNAVPNPRMCYKDTMTECVTEINCSRGDVTSNEATLGVRRAVDVAGHRAIMRTGLGKWPKWYQGYDD